MPRGRPRKTEQPAQALALFQAGATVQAVADSLGVGKERARQIRKVLRRTGVLVIPDERRGAKPAAARERQPVVIGGKRCPRCYLRGPHKCL